MADIEFRPDQQVPAGRYYVILRPVEEGPAVPPPAIPAPGNMANQAPGNLINPEPVMPAEVPQEPPNGTGAGAGADLFGYDEDGAGAVPAQPPNMGPSQNVPPNETNSQMGGKKRRNNSNTKKAKKGKGTRKLSGYMKFAQEVRPRLLKENPALRTDIPSIGRKIGEMWRNLTAAEKARY